jgi:ubiquinone biosynthesis UbiH/UbiF/VisC/COQ6 family hydroxylase
MSMPSSVEVAIVGGGVVGATLALLLVRRAGIAPARLLLIEPEPVQPPVAGRPYDLRVVAISPGNRALLEELGVWHAMDLGRVMAFERMVVWHESIPPDSPDVLRFDAAELGEADLGCIVENRNLQSALLDRCAAEGIVLRRARLAGLECDAEQARITLDDGIVQAELVVGADGSSSAVRRLAGIGLQGRSYEQQGIVATVRSERSHQNTAWQRFLASGPLALLPLASGECSLVWSARDARAQELLAMSDAQFGAALTIASAGVLGRLEPSSARAAFPLRRLTASRYVGTRCALMGDAAHVIHPLAGQGANEGLQDALALAQALAQRPHRESVGASRALQRYARERRSGNALMGAMVDGLNSLFTGSPAAVAGLASAGMGLVGRSRLAQRMFFTRAAAGRSWPRR